MFFDIFFCRSWEEKRVFWGIFYIFGCKILCFKCVFLLCYFNIDSDDEKDKDDEGYDSYGNMDNYVYLIQEDGYDIFGFLGQVIYYDYVNSVDYINVEIVEIG